MTVSGARAGGPNSDGAQAGLEFLGRQRWAAVCVEVTDGTLRCTPALVRTRDGDRLALAVPSGPPGLDGVGTVGAALVADEFTSYEQIRGVIARGTLVCDQGPPEFRLAHVASFSFRGGTPTSLTS